MAELVDGLGRRRSSRSLATGPGSRGGRWGHRPPAEYWRIYRATHPEYRERDRLRRLLEHNLDRARRIIHA